MFESPMEQTAGCPHVLLVRAVAPSATGCEACARSGGTWQRLLVCLTCGHVGCCDDSPGRHARRHARAAGHPLVRTADRGDGPRFCFVDETYL